MPKPQSAHRGPVQLGRDLRIASALQGGDCPRYRARFSLHFQARLASAEVMRASTRCIRRLPPVLCLSSRRLTAESEAHCRSPSSALRGNRTPLSSALTRPSRRSHQGTRFERVMGVLILPLRPPIYRATMWLTTCFWYSKNSTLRMSRGLAIAILTWAFTVPGWGVSTMMRSPR